MTNWSDTRLTSRRTYAYQVRACDDYRCAGFVNPVSQTF